jgi:pyruvate kinase
MVVAGAALLAIVPAFVLDVLNTAADRERALMGWGAVTAAEHLGADLIVVATHSGRTAMAVSKQ